MALLTKFTTPQIEIGEPVYVLAGFANNNAVISNTLGQFVRAGVSYNRSDYPDLYARIGYVGATGEWTPRISSSTNINTLTYGNGLFLYGTGSTGVIATSTNGITWTTRSIGLNASPNFVKYENGLYFAGSTVTPNFLATSTDTITWTSRTANATGSYVTKFVYGNGIYVYGGTGGIIATSTDAITWTSRTSGTTSSINALVYGNGIFICGGNFGFIRTSTDGITWTTRTSGTTSTINELAYINGTYIYAGQLGLLASSTDGITWTARSSGTSSQINVITYGNGLYVYAGQNGLLRTSTNITSWTARTSATTSIINGLNYGNGIYVYTTVSGGIGTSSTATILEYSPYYDFPTQFYVPPYTFANVNLILPTGANSIPQLITYVRAK